MFVLLVLYLLFVYEKIYIFSFILVPLKMTSQKRKEKQKLTLLQKAIQNCLSTNEPPTNSHSLTHSFDLQMIYRFH